MNLWNTIETGFKEIWAHKFRSLLTMLGIILGVSSLVAMAALVKGMENGLREALVEMGGLEQIEVQEEDELPVYQRHLADQSSGITMKDVHALQASSPLVHSITPTVEMSGWRNRINVTYGGRRSRPWRLIGSWPTILDVEEHRVAHGRMFTKLDNELARNVCIIGVDIRNELFGDPLETGEEVIPLGNVIQINGQPFTIIGMFEHYMTEKERKELEQRKKEQESGGPKRSKGRSHGPSGWVYRLKNNSVIIPLTTMMINFRAAAGTDNTVDPRLSSLHMEIPDIELLEPALQQVRNVLMITHNGLEDWSFRTEEDMAEEISRSIRNYRMSGSIIAAISLIVGGIGIMNIMLASISERLREIGIRKAVGASTFDVFIQILIESVVIAAIGGLVGLAVSVGVVDALSAFTPTDNDPVITWHAMGLAFVCSAAVGVIAGLIPAIKASQLHPIQALKYD